MGVMGTAPICMFSPLIMHVYVFRGAGDAAADVLRRPLPEDLRMPVPPHLAPSDAPLPCSPAPLLPLLPQGPGQQDGISRGVRRRVPEPQAGGYPGAVREPALQRLCVVPRRYLL